MDTVVGNELLKGISGGQKRRVTVGEMAVGLAQVMCLVRRGRVGGRQGGDGRGEGARCLPGVWATGNVPSGASGVGGGVSARVTTWAQRRKPPTSVPKRAHPLSSTS